MFDELIYHSFLCDNEEYQYDLELSLHDLMNAAIAQLHSLSNLTQLIKVITSSPSVGSVISFSNENLFPVDYLSTLPVLKAIIFPMAVVIVLLPCYFLNLSILQFPESIYPTITSWLVPVISQSKPLPIAIPPLSIAPKSPA